MTPRRKLWHRMALPLIAVGCASAVGGAPRGEPPAAAGAASEPALTPDPGRPLPPSASEPDAPESEREGAAEEAELAPPDFTEKRDPLSLKLTSLSLEANGEYDQRHVHTKPNPLAYSTNQSDRSWRFEQVARLGFDLTTANPDILSLSGAAGLGLSQERYREQYAGTTTEDHANGTLEEYDLRADLFRSSRLSGTAFGLQTHDRYSRPFLPSLRETRSDYGTAWNFNDATFPMELRAEHHDTRRDGSWRDYDDEHTKEDLLDYKLTWNHTENHTAKFEAEYGDRQDRYSGSRYQFGTQSTELRLDDALQLGGQNQHKLDTVVRYQEERGDIQRDLLELGPRLTLQHTPTLQSYYQYQYSREQVGQLDVDLNRVDAGIVHQVFTNLTTTANVYGFEEDLRHDSETKEFGSNVDWAYNRDNALGAFTADLGLSHDLSHTHGGATRVQLRESGSFRDPLPVTLTKPHVFIPSIVVWNSQRTMRYFPGADFFISLLRDRVLLSRNLLGRIPNGGGISVDYLYFEDRQYESSTTRVDFRVQQQFSSGWTPYYAMDLRHEDRDATTGYPLVGSDLDRHRVGVKYQQPRWAAGAELEVLRGDVDPFVAYHVFAERNFITRPTSSVDGRVEASQFFFDGSGTDWYGRRQERDVLLVESSLDARHQLTQALGGYGRVRYRYQDDQLLGVTHGVDVEAGAEYRWGDFTISASIEYDVLDIVASRDSGVGAWIKVRRELSGLLGPH